MIFPRFFSPRRAALFSLLALLAAAPCGRGVSARQSAAASGPDATGPQVPRTGRFALGAAPGVLLTGTRLQEDRRVLQSFAFDDAGGHVYLLQVEGANAAGTFAEHNARGDLVLTKLSLGDRTIAGHMVLRGFGHGVAMGIEREDDVVHVWTEVDSEATPRNSGRGSKIGRFRFADGATLDASSAAIRKFAPIAGATVCTPSFDPVHGRLAMRYVSAAGSWRVALFELAALKAGQAKPLADIALQAEFGTVQGWCTFGSYLYVYAGEAYGRGNPPPGDATLWCVDWNTGAVVETHRTDALGDLVFREPEGLAVQVTAKGPRLCFGFAAGDVRRRASIAYTDAWRATSAALATRPAAR